MTRPSLIERAYELARSGACRNVTEIKKRLAAEGYPANDLMGKSLIDDLVRKCRHAHGLGDKPAPPTPLTAEARAARSRKAAQSRKANAPPSLVRRGAVETA